MMKRVLLWMLVVGISGAGAYGGYRWYARQTSASASVFRLAPIARQDLVATISATGTIVPDDVVDVGAQVNGLIDSFGSDANGHPIDYDSPVKAGGMLARIDDALYTAQVTSDEASLAQTQAAVKVAEATRDQAKALLAQMERSWTRAQKLGESQALSQADYDAAKSGYEQAVAGLEVAESQIGEAQSQVAIAQAVLVRSRRNLFYCTITSPVDGVIIDRRVEIGQTVVSSLSAPSLFLIAKDLRKMQVLVQVNEADVGRIKPGDTVTFTVDAIQGDTFPGSVIKTRLNATMTQNVVTYTVEIAADNSELKLLPYLTANVLFVVDRRSQVLTVPNVALRWVPSEGVTSAENTPSTSAPAARVWVLRDNQPEPVNVTAGLSDGTSTEITADSLHEGDQVIVGELSAAAAAAAGDNNPFTPQIFHRNSTRPAGGSSGH